MSDSNNVAILFVEIKMLLYILESSQFSLE